MPTLNELEVQLQNLKKVLGEILANRDISARNLKRILTEIEELETTIEKRKSFPDRENSSN